MRQTTENMKTWLASLVVSRLNGLKNDPSYEFIGEVILKINIVLDEKIKIKVYVK
jgi:hypothetical protein